MSDGKKKIPNKFKMVGARTVTNLKEHLHAEDLEPESESDLPDAPRPAADQPNAVACRECGQLEYRSREYCRCSAFLRGQIQDEYLEWRAVNEAHLKDLSAKASRKANITCLVMILPIAIVLGAYSLGLTESLLLGMPPFMYLVLFAVYFGLMNLCRYFEVKARVYLDEQQFLTFEFFNE